MTSKSSHHVPLFYETFRHACEKLTSIDFYKTEKSGEKVKYKCSQNLSRICIMLTKNKEHLCCSYKQM